MRAAVHLCASCSSIAPRTAAFDYTAALSLFTPPHHGLFLASALAHYIEFSPLPAFWQANERVTAREKSVGERKTSSWNISKRFTPIYSVFCAPTSQFVPVRWEDSCRTLVFQRSVTGRVSNNPLGLKRSALWRTLLAASVNFLCCFWRYFEHCITHHSAINKLV